MKSIVICCDGTGNEFARNNTNVVKLHSMLAQDESQIAFYDTGVGTFSVSSAHTKLAESVSKTIGLALGTGFKQNVCDAYSFLVNNFEEGDRVYVFGFSRGAYTARVVGAMIRAFGILRRSSVHLASYALKLLEVQKEADFRMLNGFKRQFSTGVSPSFLFMGVWDTVASVSWAWERLKYGYTRTNPAVDVLRHAVSLDERRALFRPNLWGDEQEGQDAQEVWFPGVHCDVGGGYDRNEAGLSNIALEWMLVEARDNGLRLDDERVARVLQEQSPPDYQAKAHASLTVFWWPLEFFIKERRINRFRRRDVYTRRAGKKVLLHESVIKRIRDSTVSYQPPNLPEEYDVVPRVPYVPEEER